MSDSILEDLKLKIKNGNPVTSLIIINIGVFLFINFLRILTFISGESSVLTAIESFVTDNLSLHLSWQGIIHKPWTVITYMFTHIQIFHIFWNMITLYWFGEIVANYASTKKIIPLYLLGGIAGAFISVLLFSIFPAFENYQGLPMIGASAGATAIIIASATLVPNYKINMLFIGSVKLVYVASFVVFLDIINVASYSNIGGNISHLGGALMGYIFIYQYKKGHDLSLWINRFFDWIARLVKISGERKLKVAHKRHVSDEDYNYHKKITQQEIDAILDKISRSGYESLSKSERETLFKASK